MSRTRALGLVLVVLGALGLYACATADNSMWFFWGVVPCCVAISVGVIAAITRQWWPALAIVGLIVVIVLGYYLDHLRFTP